MSVLSHYSTSPGHERLPAAVLEVLTSYSTCSIDLMDFRPPLWEFDVCEDEKRGMDGRIYIRQNSGLTPRLNELGKVG